MERLTEKASVVMYQYGVKYYARNGFADYYHAVNKLGEYEDLEEQGLLLRLPCKVGDTVYRLGDPIKKIYEYDIQYIAIGDDGIEFADNYSNEFTEKDIGKTVFLTKEEAEAKLREMEVEE